nr:hypothetical protein [Nonlabens ulvanivorans]
MVQLSVLHELQHDDASHNCDICMISHDFQSESFQLATTTTVSTVTQIPVVQRKIDVYFAFAKASYTPSHHSIRPPPAV